MFKFSLIMVSETLKNGLVSNSIFKLVGIVEILAFLSTSMVLTLSFKSSFEGSILKLNRELANVY